MKKNILLIFFILISQNLLLAQDIQFTQDKLGACDSSSLVELTAHFYPDTIQWDSLRWNVNGMISSEKKQIIKALLGDKLRITFFYGNPVISLMDSAVISSNENIFLTKNIISGDRYSSGMVTINVDNPNLYKVNSWNISSGNIISSNLSTMNMNGAGNINLSLSYNSGCTYSTSLYLPMEIKPNLEISQTTLVDPIGIPGFLSIKLSDASIIDSVNTNVVNADTFLLQVWAGLQIISVYSGSFSWTKQIFVESRLAPNYKLVQTRMARWCDSSDAQIQITTDRGLIDSIENGSMMVINNDTAFITTQFGVQTLNIYNGILASEITQNIEIEQNWIDQVAIDEVKQATCSQSSDAWAILLYPTNIVSITIDSSVVALQDSLKNLSQGKHQIILTDNRGCFARKSFVIPESKKTCLDYDDAFSPNGDGINDVWIPTVPFGSSVSFRVYFYRDINMRPIGRKIIYEGTNSWNGLNQSTGTIGDEGFYLILGTVSFPAYMNLKTERIKGIIKLVK